MNRIDNKLGLRELAKDEKGLTTVEYALLLAVIALVAIGAFTDLGTAVSDQADEATLELNNAG